MGVVSKCELCGEEFSKVCDAYSSSVYDDLCEQCAQSVDESNNLVVVKTEENRVVLSPQSDPETEVVIVASPEGITVQVKTAHTDGYTDPVIIDIIDGE